MEGTPPRNSPVQQRRTLGLVIATTGLLALVAILLLPNGGTDRVIHTFATQNRPVLGDKEVGAEIVVFSDYKCPNCRTFEQVHLPMIERDLVKTGQAHVVFLHSPFLAPDSRVAAVGAECAYRQGNAAFLKVNAALYAQQGDERTAWATPALLRDVVKTAGLDLDTYDQCITNPEVDAQVQSDLDQHKSAGMEGTPTVFVNGRRTPAGVREIRAVLTQVQPSTRP